jgi:hypothetical protein
MKFSIYILILLTVGCSTSDERVEYTLLGELKDNNGQLIKKAETGWIPGEDIWLRITKYDTIGNVIEEYGAKPYGTKYKNVFRYDDKSRLIETYSYSFSSKDNFNGEFENYGLKEGYELKDTLVNWNVTDKQLEFKILFSYDDKTKITRERRYNVKLDSVTKDKVEVLTLDTLYESNNLDSLKVNE